MDERSLPERFSLADQVAVVTGGAGLLGPQFARALVDFGARVVLTDTNTDALAARAHEVLGDVSDRVHTCSHDVTSHADWERVRDAVPAGWGPVSILVNNAAVTNASRSGAYAADLESYPADDFRTVLDVNVVGTFLGCQVLGAAMKEAGRGAIVNIASFYGVVSPHHRIYDGTGVFQPPAYAVSKAGVIGLTKYLAALYAEEGVRVNAISPGGVFDNHNETFTSRYAKLNPMGRMAWKNELQGALVYLASDAAGYTTGQNLVVDGGWTAW